jgi:hypothetical protein
MATDLDTARHQYEMYRWAYDNGHQQWVHKARQCFEFYRGNQWTPADRARLEREGRPALTLNVVESLVRSMKGIQRALRNDVRFLPTADAGVEDARVQDALWLHVQNQNKLDFLETEIWEKGLIMGRAYYEVRVTHDESLFGHCQIRARRSQDIVLDPAADEYDPLHWPRVFDRRWVSYNDIKNLFGKDAAESIGANAMPRWYDYEDSFMAQQMGRMPYYHLEGAMIDSRSIRGHLLLGQQQYVLKNKEVFVDMQTGDISEIPESWDRERIARVLEMTPGLSTMKHMMKTVRWTVTCENEVLHDEDSPYKWFTIVPFFPTFIDGVTMGAVESLLDPQLLYNKVSSQELHIINTTANSGWKVKRGALQNMTIEELQQVGSKPGFVAELDDLNNLEKIQPNNTPQGHDRLSFKADQIMRSLAGVSDQGRGFAREDVAGQAILANQAAQDINFAAWLANLHRTKQILASRVLDCVQSHYTETRAILIARGTAFAPQIEEMTINEPDIEGRVLNDVTKGRYTTTLVPAPSRSTLSEEDFKMLLELRKLGIAIPDQLLIELSPAANKAQMIQMLQGDSNERQREAEEAAARLQQLEEALAQAKVEKEQSAAALNQARAEKAAIEAASDPDAAYERVEQQRIEADRTYNSEKLQLEREKLGLQRRQSDRDTALRLTEMDQDRDLAAMKASADRKGPNRKNKSGSPAGR